MCNEVVEGRWCNLTEDFAFQKHEYEVAMTCEGCSGAVTRILNKLGDGQFYCI